MKLYYFPGACSLASHIVAAEGGLKLSLEKVNLKDHKTESGHDFFGINPKGYVPALALENGELLTENVALLMYIGDKAGLTHEGLERYRLLEWLAFISTEIHKSFSPLFRNPSPEVAQAAREKILNRLSFINKRLNHAFLRGASFCPTDAYLYVMLRWAENMKIDISDLKRLYEYKAHMAARTGVRAALAAEGLA